MRIKPALLQSKTAREGLSHRTEAAFSVVFSAIDKMSSSYDGLDILHDVRDPNRSKEGHAARYRDYHKKATTQANEATQQALEQLGCLNDEATKKAQDRAGFDSQLPSTTASEIRTALRGMSQKDRDAAIRGVEKNGDISVLQAVMDCPTSVLTGPIGKALILNTYGLVVRKADPTLQGTLDDIEMATNHVKFALESFTSSTNKMRKPLMEENAAAAQIATKAAEKLLS